MKNTNNNLQHIPFISLVPGGHLSSKLGNIPFFIETGENDRIKEMKTAHGLDMCIPALYGETKFPAVVIDKDFKETLSEQELLYVLHKEAAHLVLNHHLSNITMIQKLSAADVYAANMSGTPVYVIKQLLVRTYDEIIAANSGDKKLVRALRRVLKIRLNALTVFEVFKNLTIEFLCFIKGIKRPDVLEA